jgi:hypothetical protein
VSASESQILEQPPLPTNGAGEGSAAPGSAPQAIAYRGPEYLDPARSWAERLQQAIDRTAGDRFKEANVTLLRSLLAAEQPGLRAMVNIGPQALRMVLSSGRYLNAYERPRIAGKARNASAKRRAVDRLVFGKDARNFYFGAVSMGGAGVRFYGEYCMVLRPSHITRARLFDRNSYDLASPPLSEIADQGALVKALRGEWRTDLEPMLALKVLPLLPDHERLTTPGQVAEQVQRDEDFVEVHTDAPFGPEHLEEVRRSHEEGVAGLELERQVDQGIKYTMSELRWLGERRRAEKELARRRIRLKSVTTTGRGSRWR